MQNLTFGLVELRKVHPGPLLQPVLIYLDGIPSLQCISCTTHVLVGCFFSLEGSASCPLDPPSFTSSFQWVLWKFKGDDKVVAPEITGAYRETHVKYLQEIKGHSSKKMIQPTVQLFLYTPPCRVGNK